MLHRVKQTGIEQKAGRPLAVEGNSLQSGELARLARTTAAAFHSTSADRGLLQSLIDYLPVLIFARSLRSSDFGRIAVWNKAAESMTGFKADAVVGRKGPGVLSPDLAAVLKDLDRRMLESPLPASFPELAITTATGECRYLRLLCVPLLDASGQPEYLLGIAEDVTVRRSEQQALRSKQAELAAVNDSSPLGLFRSDANGKCTYVNRTYERISGLSQEQALGDGWIQSVHPEDRLKVFQAWSQAARSREPIQNVYRFCHADGTIVWASVKAAPIVAGGHFEGYVGSVEDITARRAAEQELRASESRLRTITDAMPAMLAYVDANRCYRFNNLAFEHAYGMNRDAMRGMHVRDVLGDALYRQAEPYVQRVLAGETVTYEMEEEGEVYRCYEVTYIPHFLDGGPEVAGFYVMRHDITQTKLENRRLVHLAQIDSLTGLVNRAGFEQQLASAMIHCRHSGMPLALMYMDLDRFKQINDQRGHLIGDELLKSFAHRLQHAMRATDIVSRIGGDEFTVIMQDLSRPEDATRVASKIVRTMQAPFNLEDGLAEITVSIGIAYYRGDAIDAKTLIERADSMLYAAKQSGRNTFCVYLPE